MLFIFCMSLFSFFLKKCLNFRKNRNISSIRGDSKNSNPSSRTVAKYQAQTSISEVKRSSETRVSLFVIEFYIQNDVQSRTLFKAWRLKLPFSSGRRKLEFLARGPPRASTGKMSLLPLMYCLGITTEQTAQAYLISHPHLPTHRGPSS